MTVWREMMDELRHVLNAYNDRNQAVEMGSACSHRSSHFPQQCPFPSATQNRAEENKTKQSKAILKWRECTSAELSAASLSSSGVAQGTSLITSFVALECVQIFFWRGWKAGCVNNNNQPTKQNKTKQRGGGVCNMCVTV